MPDFALRNAEGYTVTGVPVLAEDLSDALAGSVARLLLVALVVMAAVLALVFRRRLRLVPLAVALGAVALTFGLMALVGAPLTMASIAVLPVLLGLGVDYAIQYQARIAEPPTARGAARAARVAAPTIATAALATAAGFLVLLLSPVPMVRGFGVLLVLGVGDGVRARADRRHRGARHARRGAAAAAAPLGALGARRGRAARRRGAAARAAGPAGAAAGRARAAGRRSRDPGRVLAVGLAVAALGWVVDTQTEVRSDLQALVPQDLPAVRDLETLQRTTGVAGEVDVVVEGRDLTDPKVRRVDALVPGARADARRATRRRTAAARRRCARRCRCRTCSRARRGVRTAARIEALLDAVPPYFSQAVITADRRTANLAFGIRLMPLDEQHEVIERMRAALDPPAGRDRAASPGCRCSPRRPTPRSRRRGGGSARCWPGCSRSALVLLARAPARRARVGAARPDRARDGLVGARAVRAARCR